MTTKKRGALAVVGVAALSAALLTPAMAATPVVPADQAMYAEDVEYGAASEVSVQVDPYSSYHWMRLDPANVLGGFDAVQSAGGLANDKFFALNARTETTYTFDEDSATSRPGRPHRSPGRTRTSSSPR